MRIIMAFFLLQCVDVLTCIGVYDVQRFAINVPEDRRHLRQGCQVCEVRKASLSLPEERYSPRLFVDSGVVMLTMPYNPIFVISSSSKPLFFKGLKNELRASEDVEA
jgi:hypothetical protein